MGTRDTMPQIPSDHQRTNQYEEILQPGVPAVISGSSRQESQQNIAMTKLIQTFNRTIKGLIVVAMVAAVVIVACLVVIFVTVYNGGTTEVATGDRVTPNLSNDQGSNNNNNNNNDDDNNNDLRSKLSAIENKISDLETWKISAMSTISYQTNKISSLMIWKEDAMSTISRQADKIASLETWKGATLSSMELQANRMSSFETWKTSTLSTLSQQADKLSSLDQSLDTWKRSSLSTTTTHTNKIASLETWKTSALPTLALQADKLTSLESWKQAAVVTMNNHGGKIVELDAWKEASVSPLLTLSDNMTDVLAWKETVSSTLSTQNSDILSLKNISPISVEEIKNDVMRLEASTGNLSSHYLTQSKIVDNHQNQLLLMSATISNLQLNISSPENIQTLRIRDKEIMLKVDQQNSKLSALSLQVSRITSSNPPSATIDSDSPTTIGYCTKNVPNVACYPCRCKALDFEDNDYYCDCTNVPRRRNCKEHYDNSYRLDGLYNIQPDGTTNMTVRCDQVDDGGGWVVIQRRFDGSTGFYRDWNEYKEGFGELDREFYLGNDHISALTKSHRKAKIELQNFSGVKKFAAYSSFIVGDESTNYKLTVGGYSGNAGDSLAYQNNMAFTTFDRDHDRYSGGVNCANTNRGAWWYNKCRHSNLNGLYRHIRASSVYHITWDAFDTSYALKETSMKIRP